ncbi:DNA polymerase III subunits gamma and tau [Kingella kingae PYKK081]|uniref:DNA polymerase III subunit gamma/tau n=1 Tax=Kingella kingae TaxID=504 RepID=UPI0002584B84|nr:DNA polymerase III subunit gamma/tau [Kingella kingae]EIC13087.1 DNA polymerase III subunits gamma and tau [Kingella kingae PYKK081]
MTAYQVLARKWRPKTFADLVGQQHVVKALQNALDKGRLHHAYLLTGTRGVGKTTIARILAKSLNCENTLHGDPCGQCQTCCDIDAGRFVDLLEIDAASNTGIDNIREVLENAQYAPTVGKYKVYIIDEVHMLSKSAFNAMLKTLEEPPEHVKFILATTDPHKVPITVLSRCLQFVLRNMTPQQVTDHLTHVLKTEQIMYEPNALALLGRAANGSMRDALSLLDQAIAMGSGGVKELDVRQMIGAVDKRYLYDLLTFLMEQDGERLLVKAQEMAANAIGFDSALNDLAMWLQRLALIKTVPSAVATDDPERERLVHLANYFSDEQIQLYYQCVIHGKQDLPLAPDEYAGFVMTLLRMLAFAPFAAKNTPSDSVIEGTQLHNPPEKKSRELAETKQPAPETEVAPDTKITPETESSLHVEVEPAYDNTPMPAETWDDEPQNEVAPDEEIAPTQYDMPELTAENWTRIVDGLSELPSIAAAQMSLSHMAWVDYANGVLTLAALRDKTQHTLTPEYLARIEQALSQWYGTAIRVQVMDYHAGEHGETPNMAHARIAQEQRDWARHQMEADPAVQKIQQLLNARWVESTLEVLTDSESTK